MTTNCSSCSSQLHGAVPVRDRAPAVDPLGAIARTLILGLLLPCFPASPNSLPALWAESHGGIGSCYFANHRRACRSVASCHHLVPNGPTNRHPRLLRRRRRPLSLQGSGHTFGSNWPLATELQLRAVNPTASTNCTNGPPATVSAYAAEFLTIPDSPTQELSVISGSGLLRSSLEYRITLPPFRCPEVIPLQLRTPSCNHDLFFCFSFPHFSRRRGFHVPTPRSVRFSASLAFSGWLFRSGRWFRRYQRPNQYPRGFTGSSVSGRSFLQQHRHTHQSARLSDRLLFHAAGDTKYDPVGSQSR